jgi:hypothetical protein
MVERSKKRSRYGVTTNQQLTLPIIRCSMIEPSMWRLTNSSSKKSWTIDYLD